MGWNKWHNALNNCGLRIGGYEGTWLVVLLAVLMSIRWHRYWTEGVLCSMYSGEHSACILSREIRESPKRRSCPHTVNIQRKATVQKLLSYWSEPTSRLPGVEPVCTILDFVMNPRRFVSSSNHDCRQNEVFYSLQHLLDQDFSKEWVGPFHNFDSTFQSTPERNEKCLIQKWLGMHQKAKQNYICLSWLLKGYQKMPQI